MISSHAADALYISSSFEKANILRVSRLLKIRIGMNPKN
jgi:hypothetical protein